MSNIDPKVNPSRTSVHLAYLPWVIRKVYVRAYISRKNSANIPSPKIENLGETRQKPCTLGRRVPPPLPFVCVMSGSPYVRISTPARAATAAGAPVAATLCSLRYHSAASTTTPSALSATTLLSPPPHRRLRIVPSQGSRRLRSISRRKPLIITMHLAYQVQSAL